MHNSTSATAEQVTAAWQKVLKRTDIGPEDNFFDLGGDPVLATQLFEEIKFKPGARLGAVSIFQAPTIAEMTAAKVFPEPIVTAVEPVEEFHAAEGYHQNYYNENSRQPYCMFVITPKLAKLEKKFAEKLRA